MAGKEMYYVIGNRQRDSHIFTAPTTIIFYEPGDISIAS